MLPPEYETVFSLLQRYIKRRPRRGPFPLESALTWSILLGTQAGNNIHGDMLEIGVEFGTSALLMLEFLSSEEQATFVDLNTPQEWAFLPITMRFSPISRAEKRRISNFTRGLYFSFSLQYLQQKKGHT